MTKIRYEYKPLHEEGSLFGAEGGERCASDKATPPSIITDSETFNIKAKDYS